jgi:hypothetical protein
MMFEGATSFLQDLASWNVCGVVHNDYAVFHKGVLTSPETYMFKGATAFLPSLSTHWPTACESLPVNVNVNAPENIAVLLETIHASIYATNNTIINTYFDTVSREPKMTRFVYQGMKIDIPEIFLNPPSLFGLEEVTMTTSGSTKVGLEYRFRKNTNAGNIFDAMIPNKIHTL